MTLCSGFPSASGENKSSIVNFGKPWIGITGMKWDNARKLDPARPRGQYHSRTSPSIAFQTFCVEWASECLRVLKPSEGFAAAQS